MSSRVMRCTDDAVPRVSRPSAWPGKSAACQRSAARSAGSSACIRISSRMTVRSASMSSGRSAGSHMMSLRMSSPSDEVLGEEPDVEGRVLLRGEGVAVAAHLVELLGDGRGGAPLGALEEEVLQEVRRPGELAGLVTRAGADPVGDRHRADIRHGLGDQADAARQDGRLDQRRRERPREGRRSPPRSPRSPRSFAGVGRTRAEVAQVRHQLGLEGVLEGRPVGLAGAEPTTSGRTRPTRADRPDAPEPTGRRRPDRTGPGPARRAALGRRGQRQRHLALRVDVVDPDLDGLARASARPRRC